MSRKATALTFHQQEIPQSSPALSLLAIFRHRFLPSLPLERQQTRKREGKRRRHARRAERSQAALFPVEGARIRPNTRTRNGRLKEVLLRDKPEVIRLSRGKLSFLPAGFFVGLRPPTNIHSRLTLLFTVCGYLLVSPHPRPPEFSPVALFAVAPILSLSTR
jgi:hypothetical protein